MSEKIKKNCSLYWKKFSLFFTFNVNTKCPHKYIYLYLYVNVAIDDASNETEVSHLSIKTKTFHYQRGGN